MSVIIDQFEVIMDSGNTREDTEARQDTEAPPTVSPFRPTAVTAVFEQMRERADRVRAH